MEKSVASDEDWDLVLQLFDGKIGAEPTDDELTSFHTEGKARYVIQIAVMAKR
jgi:hypothetical protein